ncbi:MAG: RNA methyltransferase [Labilithrix sp.]|nr:RNA methyltransferase [Labilithrix sp.]MCW5813942.1 RNA methyltransferase [Labilithrix sp.]
MRALSIALVHHPVVDAGGAIVTSTLTTMDVHDLSRSARTYGCASLYLVHPIPAQQELAHRIIEHWTHGSSAKRIPDRKEALATVRVVATIEEARAQCGAGTELWATAARTLGAPAGWTEAAARLAQPGPPVLLLFGTSWGLAPSVIAAADVLIEPIHGPHADWNHLSVRAACAIALDRLTRVAT